tara:strand:- start:222 stop:884 length:663 start_codon:yes stop_codon:yes gene_type:complete
MKAKEVTIPTNWKEIKLKTFRAYQLMKEAKRKLSSLEEKMITLELFCDLTAQEVRSLNIKDLNKLYEDLTKILSSDQAQFKFEQTFKFNDKEFGFIPNLSKISTGEWADFEEFMKQGGYWKNVHKIMAILWRPIKDQYKEKYSIEAYSDTHVSDHSEAFLDLGMDKVIGAQAFFLRLGTDLSMISLTSTTKRKLEKARANLTDTITQSQKNTAGITRWLS